MPLLDHFHEPTTDTYNRESFHVLWVAEFVADLNRRLRPAYLAQAHAKFGPAVGADVAEFRVARPSGDCNGPGGGVAVAPWVAPAAPRTVGFALPDDLEVRVIDRAAGRELVAVIELVSPANKDRPDHRRLFAAKCAAYLARGLGLVVIDVVTSRRANLHAELMTLLGHEEPDPPDLYAVSYRPRVEGEAALLDIWPAELAVGRELPVVPLALRGAFFVPLDLEATYSEARERNGQ